MDKNFIYILGAFYFMFLAGMRYNEGNWGIMIVDIIGMVACLLLAWKKKE